MAPLRAILTFLFTSSFPAPPAPVLLQFKLQPADSAVYVPSVPHIFPVARLASNNAFIRDVLVFDEAKRIKPRLSWYDPYDTTWVPSGWFTEVGPCAPCRFNPVDPALERAWFIQPLNLNLVFKMFAFKLIFCTATRRASGQTWITILIRPTKITETIR